MRNHIVDENGRLVRRTPTVSDIIQPPQRRFRKVFWGLGLVVLALLGWLTGTALWTWAKVSVPNLNGASPVLGLLSRLNPNALRGEGDGRINILILGVGGKNHPGGSLADTIIVASVDPKNRQLAMLSIPRDLYVKIPGAGANKINYAHAWGEENAKTSGGGPTLTKKVISEILDLPIHYFVRGDFDGFVKLVDALGGVTVNVEKAINDPYFPDPRLIGYEPFYLKAGLQTLDGQTALKYARSRETTSDFDRAARQQQLLAAIGQKALSAGVLTNPAKVNKLMRIAGEHLRTDLTFREIERLFEIVKNLETSKTVFKILDSSPGGLLISSGGANGYYLVPRAGPNNFSQIRSLAHEIFAEPFIAQEAAALEVRNASGQDGLAGEVAASLKAYGYKVKKTTTAPAVQSQTVVLDGTAGGKPYTVGFLAKRFKAKVQETTLEAGVEVVLVVGENFRPLGS